MLIRRWQAPMLPDKNQVVMMFEAEGLQPVEEVFPASTLIRDHRHPLDEVRMVISGQLMMDIAGNRLLLRAGDRIVVPSNTKHSKKVEGDQACVSICSYKSS